MFDPLCTHSHWRKSQNTWYIYINFILQVVLIQSQSERCCYVRFSQYCHWYSLLSKQLQVCLVHRMNAVATALSQKRQLHIPSNLHSTPDQIPYSPTFYHLGWCPCWAQWTKPSSDSDQLVLWSLEPLTKVCIVTVADVGLHRDECLYKTYL